MDRRWPDFLYGEAWPGADYLVQYPEFIDTLKEHCVGIISRENLPTDIQYPELQTAFDWAYCLQETERGILQKPFVEWTIDDIVDISRYINRLSIPEPGAYRTTWKEPTKVVTEEDWETVAVINQRPYSEWSDDEKLFLTTHYENFLYSNITHPDLIQSKLQSTLDDFKVELSKLDRSSLTTEEFENELLNIAVLFQITVGNIHPFADGHRRLTRILLGVILLQHDIRLPSYRTATNYTDVILKCVRKKNYDELIEFTKSLPRP
jgi:hypothetical protein